MRKSKFLSRLRRGLKGMSRTEKQKLINFYSEMIDDRMEEGLSEAEAVGKIGPVEKVLENLSENSPKKASKRRCSAWEIVLLALGSPIWASLLISAAAVVFSLYVSLWAVVISLWAAFVSVIACAAVGLILGFVYLFSEFALTGAALLGAGMFLSGLGIFAFYGCRAATVGLAMLLKKCVSGRRMRHA